MKAACQGWRPTEPRNTERVNAPMAHPPNAPYTPSSGHPNNRAPMTAVWRV